MSRLTIDTSALEIIDVRVSNVELTVDLSDGRTITAPILFFPRLANGTRTERNNWRLIGRGHGITWPDLDEDISVECLLSGRVSGESQRSLAKWLKNRSSKMKK